jgi:hypothetical protein
MSYNILAQELLESHQYLYNKHESAALKWTHRKQILLREIEEANADVCIDPPRIHMHARKNSQFSLLCSCNIWLLFTVVLLAVTS